MKKKKNFEAAAAGDISLTGTSLSEVETRNFLEGPLQPLARLSRNNVVKNVSSTQWDSGQLFLSLVLCHSPEILAPDFSSNEGVQEG